MLDIQKVNDTITLYRRNKGFIKKLIRSDHSAILATEAYLKSLQNNTLLSHQDLFSINRFFLLDHPIKSATAAYTAWLTINYLYFCELNSVQVHKLAQLLQTMVPLKYAGFTTCSKAGYQKFPENFSKLTLEQLDNRKNSDKMAEFFKVSSKAFQQNKCTEDGFVALSKLCVEGMLNQANVDHIQQSSHPKLLAECLILMKHSNILTPENQQIVIGFPYLQQLQHTMICLEKIGLLTQEDFAMISKENNHPWLLALEEMPKELVSTRIWEGLVNLLKNSDINDFKTDIKAYADMLKQDVTIEQMEKISLADEDIAKKIQATSSQVSTSRLFSVSPANLQPTAEEVSEKINLAP